MCMYIVHITYFLGKLKIHDLRGTGKNEYENMRVTVHNHNKDWRHNDIIRSSSSPGVVARRWCGVTWETSASYPFSSYSLSLLRCRLWLSQSRWWWRWWRDQIEQNTITFRSPCRNLYGSKCLHSFCSCGHILRLLLQFKHCRKEECNVSSVDMWSYRHRLHHKMI